MLPTKQLPDAALTRVLPVLQYDADGNVVTPAAQGLTDTQLRAADVKISLDGEQVTTVTPNISVAAAISGQVTVTTPGTSIQGGDVVLTNGVFVKALTGNTGNMFIGYATGDNRTGFELDANQLILVQVSNLNQLWFDASVGGEKICWLKA
jgi:hypothetical protein